MSRESVLRATSAADAIAGNSRLRSAASKPQAMRRWRGRRWPVLSVEIAASPLSLSEPQDSAAASDEQVFHLNGKTIDFGTLELRVNGTTIQLTLMEAKLLRHLIRSKGRTVSRKSILEDVWGLHEDTDTRAIDNFIVRLRRYIEKDPSKPKHLLIVRGVGYRFLA